MKTIFRLIKITIVFLIIAALFMLFINETFIYEVYKDDGMNEGIPIKRFLYLYNSGDNNALFYTPLSEKSLNDMKDYYLDSIDSCYGKYYYDKNNDITITDYKITNGKYLKSVFINYEYDNYCSDDYVLSDMWVYEFNQLSEYQNGDISEKGVIEIIKKIYNTKRVLNPIITDYEITKNLKVECKLNNDKYTLEFKDFKENELLIKKVVGDKVQFAVYEVENVIEFLDSLK